LLVLTRHYLHANEKTTIVFFIGKLTNFASKLMNRMQKWCFFYEKASLD